MRDGTMGDTGTSTERLQATIARMTAEAREREGANPQELADPEVARRDRLLHHLGILGFPAENLSVPIPAMLPDDWRGAASAYLGSLAKYVANGMGFVATSQHGGGKTTLLALAATVAFDAGIPCAYFANGGTLIYAVRMIQRRQDARAGAFENFAEDVDLTQRWPASACPIVLLDDVQYFPVGGYNAEAAGWETVAAFLYARMAAGLATCLAANIPALRAGGVDGILDKPGMGPVRDRATVYLPESLRLVTERGSQRRAE